MGIEKLKKWMINIVVFSEKWAKQITLKFKEVGMKNIIFMLGIFSIGFITANFTGFTPRNPENIKMKLLSPPYCKLQNKHENISKLVANISEGEPFINSTLLLSSIVLYEKKDDKGRFVIKSSGTDSGFFPNDVILEINDQKPLTYSVFTRLLLMVNQNVLKFKILRKNKVETIYTGNFICQTQESIPNIKNKIFDMLYKNEKVVVKIVFDSLDINFVEGIGKKNKNSKDEKSSTNGFIVSFISNYFKDFFGFENFFLVSPLDFNKNVEKNKKLNGKKTSNRVVKIKKINKLIFHAQYFGTFNSQGKQMTINLINYDNNLTIESDFINIKEENKEESGLLGMVLGLFKLIFK